MDRGTTVSLGPNCIMGNSDGATFEYGGGGGGGRDSDVWRKEPFFYLKKKMRQDILQGCPAYFWPES